MLVGRARWAFGERGVGMRGRSARRSPRRPGSRDRGANEAATRVGDEHGEPARLTLGDGAVERRVAAASDDRAISPAIAGVRLREADASWPGDGGPGR